MSMMKELRKKRADERLAVTKDRTPEQQLQRLDEKYGAGLGAQKERAKLAKRIADRSAKAKAKKNDTDAFLNRFCKKHWVNGIVFGVGYRDEEDAIVVYASDREEAALPAEFEGKKVLFEEGEQPVALDTK